MKHFIARSRNKLIYKDFFFNSISQAIKHNPYFEDWREVK